MRLIGCDLHASQQSIAMLDRDTGVVIEKMLTHDGGAVREFYASIPPPVVVGIEATGSMGWFLWLMEELVIECRVGHPTAIRKAETRRQKHDRRDAALLLQLGHCILSDRETALMSRFAPTLTTYVPVTPHRGGLIWAGLCAAVLKRPFGAAGDRPRADSLKPTGHRRPASMPPETPIPSRAPSWRSVSVVAGSSTCPRKKRLPTSRNARRSPRSEWYWSSASAAGFLCVG